MRFRGVGIGATALGLACLVGAPSVSWALTSVEGFNYGDQGYYWTTPSESWIFPHRIGNSDNRVMLQLNAVGLQALPAEALFSGNIASAGTAGIVFNALPEQAGSGGGVIIELIDNLNLGLWFSTFSPGLNDSDGSTGPTSASFIGRALGATNWTHANTGGALNDIQDGNIDPGPDQTLFGQDATRKIDLFLSYWLPDAGIEAGLRLWYGSASFKSSFDDSVGPIDIDTDSDPATGGTPPDADAGSEDALGDLDSKFSLSDFGFGVGGGFSGIEGFRADLGLDFNFKGASWEPGDLEEYVDINGFGFGGRLRAHYALTDTFTLGAFFGIKTDSMSFTPKKNRDGGDLYPVYEPDADTGQQLGSPPSAAPPNAADPDLTTVEGSALALAEGTTYKESSFDIQAALLLQFLPVSWARLYGSVGFDRRAATAGLEVGDVWYARQTGALTALPFIHVGFAGRVFDWMDVTLGARKRWQSFKLAQEAFDDRIPDNDEYQGPSGTTDNPGGVNDNNTNANRREQKSSTSQTVSDTALMLGARFHWGPLQIVAHMQPTFLVNGPYFVSGNTTAAWLGWVNMIYDWDFAKDATSGDGTGRFSPFDYEAPVAAGPVQVKTTTTTTTTVQPDAAPATVESAGASDEDF